MLARYVAAGAREVLIRPIRDEVHQLERCIAAATSISALLSDGKLVVTVGGSR